MHRPLVNVIIIEQPVALLGFAQLLTWIFLSFIAASFETKLLKCCSG